MRSALRVVCYPPVPLPARRPLSTLALALIPRAVALNLALGAVVGALKLPVYLDSVGTILVGGARGPVGRDRHGDRVELRARTARVARAVRIHSRGDRHRVARGRRPDRSAPFARFGGSIAAGLVIGVAAALLSRGDRDRAHGRAHRERDRDSHDRDSRDVRRERRQRGEDRRDRDRCVGQAAVVRARVSRARATAAPVARALPSERSRDERARSLESAHAARGGDRARGRRVHRPAAVGAGDRARDRARDRRCEWRRSESVRAHDARRAADLRAARAARRCVPRCVGGARALGADDGIDDGRARDLAPTRRRDRRARRDRRRCRAAAAHARARGEGVAIVGRVSRDRVARGRARRAAQRDRRARCAALSRRGGGEGNRRARTPARAAGARGPAHRRARDRERGARARARCARVRAERATHARSRRSRIRAPIDGCGA